MTWSLGMTTGTVAVAAANYNTETRGRIWLATAAWRRAFPRRMTFQSSPTFILFAGSRRQQRGIHDAAHQPPDRAVFYCPDSIGVAVLLPRAVVAGEATSRPPLASPARTELALGVRADLPSTHPFAALYKDAAAGLNSACARFAAWPTERRFTPFRLEHPAPVLVASVELLPGLTSPARLLASPPMGGRGPTLCQISDTVYRADGSPAQGTVLISWQAFTTAAGQSVTPGSLLVTLDAGGGFNASVAPNTGASPAGSYYRALFKLNEVKAHMRWLVGNGNEGKIQELEARVGRHEAYLQRFGGIATALACLLTFVHFAMDFLRYKR